LRRHLRGVIELLVLATLAAAGLYLNGAISHETVVRAYVLFCCAAVVFFFIQVIRHIGDQVPNRARRPERRGGDELPGELVAIADSLRAGSASRPDFDRSVRPMLREITADRLTRAGVDLARERPRAEELLGPKLAEMALQEGPTHAGVQERGPRPAEIAELLDRLVELAS